MSFGQPKIPGRLMGTLVEIRAGAPTYYPEQGGQYRPAFAERIPFQGAVLPLSDTDFKRMPQGTYTADTRKVYTNGHALTPGGVIEDATGQQYTVGPSLDYGFISPVRRYLAECRRATGSRGMST